MNVRFFAVPLCTFVFISCGHHPLKEEKPNPTSESFVHPPNPNVNIPYQDYSVDAVLGDTLFYATGSIIVVPASAFVDKAGNIIKGKVQLKYREFSNPLDFFVAGI